MGVHRAGHYFCALDSWANRQHEIWDQVAEGEEGEGEEETRSPRSEARPEGRRIGVSA